MLAIAVPRSSGRRCLRAASLLAPLALALVLSAPGLAAPPATPPAPKPPSGDFGEEVTVRVAEIQVLVTDKDNTPITGLTPADLEVREEGEQRKVAFLEPFATRDLAVRLLPQPAPLVRTPTEKPQAEEGLRIPTPAPERRIVLLFDAYNSRTQDRHRWVDAARGWVASGMRDEDLVAIAILERDGVRVIQPFTREKALLAGVLANSSFMPPGTYHDHATVIAEMTGNLLPCEKAPSRLRCGVTALTPVMNDIEMRTRGTLAALHQFVSTLGAIPGRKILMFISNGVIDDPAAVAGNVLLAKFGSDSLSYTLANSAFQIRLQGDVLQMTRVANAAGVTFFTFDPRSSARRDMTGDVDQREMTSFSRGTDPYAQVFDMTRGSLDTVAIRTGGRGLHGPKIETTLPAAAASIGGIYTLGYYRDPTLGGAPKIKVKVARKGAVVTFVDRFDPLRTPPRVVRLELGIGKPTPGEGRSVAVPVIVQLPLDEIEMTRDGDTWSAELGLYAEAVDPRGKRLAALYEPVVVEVTGQQYEQRTGRMFTHTLRLEVPPGAYRLRVRMTDSAFKHAAERAVDVTVHPDFTLQPGIQESVQNQNSGQ